MQLTVIHRAFEDQEKPVAKIDCNGLQGTQALEYAYRRTQNINGSWSKGEQFEDGTPNPDYHEDIRVITDLEVDEEGTVWGLRSTSMGDIIEIQGQRWAVAGMGFVLESEYDEELV